MRKYSIRESSTKKIVKFNFSFEQNVNHSLFLRILDCETGQYFIFADTKEEIQYIIDNPISLHPSWDEYLENEQKVHHAYKSFELEVTRIEIGMM